MTMNLVLTYRSTSCSGSLVTTWVAWLGLMVLSRALVPRQLLVAKSLVSVNRNNSIQDFTDFVRVYMYIKGTTRYFKYLPAN